MLQTALSEMMSSLQMLQMISWRSVMVYGGIMLSSYIFYLIFIQQFLSPLRKVPGMTFIPLIGNMRTFMAGEAMESSIQMMKDYGQVMRYYFMFGSERLLITDPDVMKQVFVTNSRNYIKPPSRLKMFKDVLGDGLLMSEGNKHSVHKRLMSPAFNRSSIISMLPTFGEVGENLIRLWKSTIGDDSSSEILVQEDLCRATLDIIGKSAFGYEFNALKDKNTEVVLAFHSILGGGRLNWRFLIPKYFDMPFSENLKLRADLNTMRRIVDTIIMKKRQALQENAKDTLITGNVLGMMMLARDEATGLGMTDLELRDEVMTLMLAGHETTAVAMAWSLLVMAQHQDLQQKAREEILTVCKDQSQNISLDRLQKLEFLDRFIKEILRYLLQAVGYERLYLPLHSGRMYPPLPITLRQALGPDVFKGQYPIPKDTIMTMAIGPMMRSPNIFTDPDTFDPDRYLDKSTNDTLYSFMPFLVGPRMCLGYKFAKLEMKTLLVLLLKSFKYELIPGIKYTRSLRTTMRPAPSLQLKVSTI